ncbi:hypothetical protein GIB67_034139, partial [Kingdonia uniflora]
MGEGGYYCSKKTDDICDDVVEREILEFLTLGFENYMVVDCVIGYEKDARAAFSMSRVRCILRGLDFKAYLLLFIIVPTCVLVLFSNEVDILTIRWNELYPYITQFVLLESNSTFTGLPKPHVFAGHRDQFKFIEPRLTYGTIGGRFKKGENPFVEEAYQRVALDQLLKIAGISDDDLLIMSDVDEIPSSHTINLLRWCDEIPQKLHLRLKNYYILLNSQSMIKVGEHPFIGWHCSFCFRFISEFVFKMKAYSHFDRVRFSYYLNPKRVQDVICKGSDLFDMLPEEYTFKDIIGKLGPIPHSFSAVHLPAFILNNAEKYKFLLPGNCKRES